MKKISFLVILLCFFNGFSQNGLIQSGPMVGYCEMTEAVIWVQTKENAAVKIDYFATDNPSIIFTSDTYNSSKETGFTYHIVLDKLQPGKKYKYAVFINNKKAILPYETSFSSKKLWQWREDAPDFTVALGSCTYINEPEFDRPGKGYGSGYSIFESINSKNPDIMLWGGDNVYLREADWDSKTGIMHRYTHSRSIKEMQPLLAKTQNFAIWDDHDFGPNDSDRSFYNKNLTLEVFKDFWANKSYGMSPEQNEGNYSTFNWGDAQFFLLDDRFFKSPNDRKTGARTLLGDKQFEWLIDALTYSTAPFKIIYFGGQVITTAARFENYSTYPEEKEKLLKEILDNNIKGVLFLSGDRHFSELSKLDRSGTYPLYDWTVSPLTSGVSDSYKEDKNTNKVEESLFAVNNFGIISFSGNKENRQIKLSLYDKDGKELWNKVILKKDLD
ncbi:MAG: alkaline phosphatase D family protein [Flavobacterium sp.]|uniref:alkaline phosphatase D family protein n=1 Tax=Flavobacterium sp. TaxID=239 RepID=UPI0026058966|nr:alkaline phosphatase D family protein [Flavobacterium sp.]MDD5151306.1 alkaline phosphatase D family protein [Flavobacterium sp.]